LAASSSPLRRGEREFGCVFDESTGHIVQQQIERTVQTIDHQCVLQEDEWDWGVAGAGVAGAAGLPVPGTLTP